MQSAWKECLLSHGNEISISPASKEAKQMEHSGLVTSLREVKTKAGRTSRSHLESPRLLASLKTWGSCIERANTVDMRKRTNMARRFVEQSETTRGSKGSSREKQHR